MTDLNLEAFILCWERLCTSRAIPINFEQAQIYFEIVRRELTKEEFETAIVLCIRNLNRIPTPKELVEMVKPPPEILAVRIWEEILSQEDFSKPTTGVPKEAIEALQVVGGRQRVAMASDAQRSVYFRKWSADYLDRVKLNLPCLQPQAMKALEGTPDD